MQVLLIAGKSGSGKTCLGQEIEKLLNSKKKRVLRTEYSKYIKMYAKEILGIEVNSQNKPRKFLQDVGSLIREDFHDELFFIRRMLEDFRLYEQYFDVVIISDVRLKKEIEEMKKSKYSTKSIYIANDTENNLTEEERKHITETELDFYESFDYKRKVQDIEELKAFAKQIIEGVN